MNNLAVFQQMTSNTAALFGVMRREIGVKSNNVPFAIKSIEALKSLGNNLSEEQAYKAASTFLSSLQTLTRGGITLDDFDKIDMVKRGGVITLSARVEAFYLAACRKGYRIIDSIIAVPKEDNNTTYFKEIYDNGEMIYILEDKRYQPDRTITAERIIEGYFSKFICRLEITDVQSNKRILMINREMSNDELIRAAQASDNGIFLSKWEEYTDDRGYLRKRKVITNEYNKESIWYKWTSEMVAKTVLRRALKRVKEVLPQLKETIYAFEDDYMQEEQPDDVPKIDIPIEMVNVDLNNLTDEQNADVKEMFEIYKANPKLAFNDANMIAVTYNGNNAQEIINTYYASIVCMKPSNNLYPIIKHIFDKPLNNTLICIGCGNEIKSEKSIKYYSKNPNRSVKCFDCNKKGGRNE